MMLSNFVFVLVCFCSCNCQTSNQNFGIQSNAKPIASRDPYSPYNSPHLNSNIQPLVNLQTYTTKAPVAHITDINASDNNFQKAPETIIKPTISTAGQRVSNNNPKPTRAPEQSRTPTYNINRPLASFGPVNPGNNNVQQVVYYQPIVNNNPQQNINFKPTNTPANTVIRTTISPLQTSNVGFNNQPRQPIVLKPTISPLQTSNVGFNNQPRQPIVLKPTLDVTTSDPKIFFPEEDKNLNRKPLNHNRQPVHSTVCDTANELLYPGDREGDWACDCKPGYIYHPLSNKCWESHRRGPCSESQLLILNKNNKVPECQYNVCPEQDLVFFKNSCYKLGSLEPCSQEHGPRPIMLTVDATTMELICSDLHSVKCDNNICCLGSKREVGHNCIKV